MLSWAVCRKGGPIRQAEEKEDIMNKKHILNAVRELSKKFPQEKERIRTGVKQAAKLWDKRDGSPKDFENFCSGNFFAGDELQALFERFESKFEQIQNSRKRFWNATWRT